MIEKDSTILLRPFLYFSDSNYSNYNEKVKTLCLSNVWQTQEYLFLKKGKQMTIISHCASHFMWLSNNEPAYGGQCQLSSLYNSSLICLSLNVAHIHHQQEHDDCKNTDSRVVHFSKIALPIIYEF